MLAGLAESRRGAVWVPPGGAWAASADCGPGARSSARERQLQRVGPRSMRLPSRTSTSTTGATSFPWVCGDHVASDRTRSARALAAARRARGAGGVRNALRDAGHVRSRFEPKEYVEGEPSRRRASRSPRCGFRTTVQTYGFRVSNSTRTLAYSATRAQARSSPTSPSRSTSSCARRRSRTATRTASPGAISLPTRRSRPRGLGRQEARPHAPPAGARERRRPRAGQRRPRTRRLAVIPETGRTRRKARGDSKHSGGCTLPDMVQRRATEDTASNERAAVLAPAADADDDRHEEPREERNGRDDQPAPIGESSPSVFCGRGSCRRGPPPPPPPPTVAAAERRSASRN